VASLAYAQEDGRLVDGDKAARAVKDKIREAREHRKQFEPTWQLNLAYAAGQHWTVLQGDRLLRRIQDVDPLYENRELYAADKITEYRMLALGELGSSDDRPELLLVQDDEQGEDFQAQLNRALAYCWDYECEADEAMAEADRLCVDLGTSAIRVRYDPSVGPVREGEIPHLNGKPLLNPDEALQAVASAATNGQTLEFKPIKEGRITWEACSALNLLVPPGIVHERFFPWECVVRPVLLSSLRAEFGAVAADIKEDKDIGSTLGRIGDASTTDLTSYALGQGRQTRLRDHAWLFSWYGHADEEHPRGRVMHFAGNDLKLMRTTPQLPYARLNERGEPVEWRSGISYLHWWRVTGRFWSRGLVEALKDPQFFLNKQGTQVNEIIDKGMPYVLQDEATETSGRQTRIPFEIVKYRAVAGAAPQPVQGIGPGPWLDSHRERILQDMEQAAGIRSPSLGENPENVQTYSQLARLAEADQVKRSVQQRDRRLAIRQAVEHTVYDIRDHWGPEKHLALPGDDDRLEAHSFNATKVPPFFVVKIAKGEAKPRSQAAELTKVEQIWRAALESRAVEMNPQAWLEWYHESLDAGQTLELPSMGTDEQVEKAERENERMIEGEEVEPAYYDPLPVHLPIHREAQIQAEQMGDFATWKRIETHNQRHYLIEAENIKAVQANVGAEPEPMPAGAPAAEPAQT
jgi:hypothetical protein